MTRVELRKFALVSLIAISSLVLSACPSNSGGGGTTGGKPPLAPAGLTATAGDAQVTLTWSASSGATTYNVKRATVSTGPFTTIATPTASPYVDTGLTNGTTYYYYVTAVDSFGESANSKEAAATPNPPLNPPPTPTGLQATAGDATVNLIWSVSATATSYHVNRATTSGGPYTQISGPTTNSYADTALTNGTTYYYVVSALNAAGESADSTQVSATPQTTTTIPPAPTGVVATAGNTTVMLTWNASAGATSYQVKRATVNGGPYTQTGSSVSSSPFTDTGLTNGTTYFYVIVASNTAGLSPNSAQVSAIPSATNGTNIQVTVDALSNRHVISPYIYGTNFPQSEADITATGMTLVRWGGNSATRYNWVNFDTNAANDYYFVNRAMGSAPLYSDSTQFVSNVISAGGNPLMTIGMLPWVAKDQSSYSFSVAKYGAQCSTEPSNSDAGNGVKTDCATNVTGNNPTDANATFLDGPPAPGDPPGSVYRNQWLSALVGPFGATQPHLYDLDNEIDIWGSTHRDVHPNPTGYNEMRDTFIGEAQTVITYDPQATRFGPVSCCWYFYWNGANNADKAAHGGVDFLPWWLNEVFWSDTIALTRSVDVLDIHAYPDGPDGLSSMTHAQQQAAALRVFRDYWDPTYVSESSVINQAFVTQIQPLKTIPFRIPRMRGMLNSIYPGTPLSITEWNAAFAGESDFSTALADADAYGIFGRERVSYAARWTSPVSANPNYLALKLYRNYDGAHDVFGSTSVSAIHNADPGLFSVYSALSQSGGTMTLMVVNKDPVNEARITFTLNNFTPTSFATYALTSTSPASIVATASQGWNASQTFPPYSATLVVVSGSIPDSPAAEWDINPETIQVPASSFTTLSPTIVSAVAGATVTLQSAQFDPGYTAGGTLTIKTALVTQSGTGNGAITVAAGSAPGFYHFTVTALDSTGVTTKQGGWILIGNPAATLTKTGDNQTGAPNSTVTFSATLVPGSSGGTNSGASILFSTSAGSFGGAQKVIVVTNGSGVATVTLTLPSSAATVKVVAEGPYGLGHPVASFTETSQ